MSRGPGKIERAIETIFITQPGDAYTAEDLIDRVYQGTNRAEKKHRVSVLRAARKVCERHCAWTWSAAENMGNQLIFWNRYDVMSYATMRLKADFFTHYRGKDKRMPSHWRDRGTPEFIAARLAPGGDHHRYVVPGGAWWKHVALNIAERDGVRSPEVIAIEQEQNRLRACLGMPPAYPA